MKRFPLAVTAFTGLALASGLTIGAQPAPLNGRFEALGQKWITQDQGDWDTADPALRLVRSGQPGVPRRPTKFAIAETAPFGRVTVEVEMKRDGRSLIIVYAWQDENHWNYAHISSDEAAKVNVHNGMFHVFGGERVRISALDGPASLPALDWVPVKLVFDGSTGLTYVEVNGKRNPSLEAVDFSLRHGRIGLGSFNETGSFRNLKISGIPAGK
jgi:hypothetical protein